MFCHSSLRFTREKLLNIKQHIPHNICMAFDCLDILLDILVGGTAVLFKRAYRLGLAALCFMETWLSETISDSMLHLPGFQLFRVNHIAELTGEI